MTEKKPPVFVLLDLDDTILDFHQAEANAVSKTLAQLGIEPKESTVRRYSQINAGRWELLEQGLITREEVLTSRFEMLFGELGVEGSGTQAQKIYEGLLGQGHWFMPGAEELLEELYGKYPLYIVSNGNMIQINDTFIKWIGRGKLLGIPTMIVIAAAVYIIIGIGLKSENYITDNKVNIRNYWNIHWRFSFKFYCMLKKSHLLFL